MACKETGADEPAPDPAADRTAGRAWRSFIEVSIHMQSLLDDSLRENDQLSLFDYHVLLLLAEAEDERARMGEIARRMVFPPSTLTYQVRSLEKRGLVVRERDPADRRATLAILTASGLRALQRAAPEHLRLVDDHFVQLARGGELETMERFLRRVSAHLPQGPRVDSSPT